MHSRCCPVSPGVAHLPRQKSRRKVGFCYDEYMEKADITADHVIQALRELADPERAQHSARFFKTGPGEYGEGDEFIGVIVPDQRKVAREYRKLPLVYVEKLLQSPIHEVRLTAVFILVDQFKSADESGKNKIARFYLDRRARINNWDLVDSSASYILGPWLEHEDRRVLYDLAKSVVVWDRRIAVLAAGYFIRDHDFADTFALADILMNDKHDLMHKAIGWMLREVGKRDEPALKDYLSTRYQKMPRTMLRYAIEKLPPELRKAYLSGLVI
jgi:3-methyladenine DNA glycosylase AlkD